jgi:hypothetical protein
MERTMNNLVSKLFFGAGLLAYLAFFADRAQAFGIHDYSTDVMVLPLLGLLGHFAFERKTA